MSRTGTSSIWLDSIERVAQARREVGQTEVRPGAALALVVAFILLIWSGPVATVAKGLRSNSYSETMPRLELPSEEPAGWSVFTLNRSLLGSITELSDWLERVNWLATVIRPSAQSLLISLGAGTEQVWQGQDGWLFFKPDVDHVIGPGFLRETELARRAAMGDTLRTPPQPDPRAAIQQFAGQLAARSIALVVVPTPVKPSVHPQQLARDPGLDRGAVNPSRETFLRELREAGLLVFDPLPSMLEQRRRGGSPLYLATDTHWRPETVQALAQRLDRFIAEHVDLPSVPPPDYRIRETVVSNMGDTAELLDLPHPATQYPPERITIRAVTTASGGLWRPDTSADVLVLGDSFSNVFSLGAMGWGEGAGLVEQLSYAMARPIDRLTQNDGGAFASRQMLADELRRGRDRLADKRLVIYQFAERELSQGDWKFLDLGEPQTASPTFLTPVTGEPIVVRGVIADLAPVPRPGTVPYKDHIVALHLVDVVREETGETGGQALVYMWSMRDNVLTRTATYRLGQTLHLRLTPWADVAEELDRINRAELPDDAIRLAQPWWGEPTGQ